MNFSKKTDNLNKPKAQAAFNELKKWFIKKPILIMPDTSKPFQIECDGSKYVSEAVLIQRPIPMHFDFKNLLFNETEL